MDNVICCSLIYLLMFFPSLPPVFSQPCSDLFISEVVFWEELTGAESGKINHTVEIFNPTKEEINMSGYGIKLITMDNDSVIINLNGYLNSNETFVLSNDNVTDAISLVTDQFSSDLKFDSVVVLELIKNGLTTLDRIGNKGVGLGLDEIDLDSLTSDSYIESININMGSIKSLNIRRDALVQEGKPIFEFSKSFFSEWELFPGFQIEHLGLHECSCLSPVFFFYPNSLAEPEMYYPEGFGAVEWQIRVTEPLPVDVILSLNPHWHHFMVPDVPAALVSTDWIFNTALDVDITWVASTEEQYFTLITDIVVDNIEEGLEGSGVWLAMVDDNGTGATISNTGRFFDFIIFDPNTAVKNIFLDHFKIFPTLVTSQTPDIQWEIEGSYEVESVKIIHSGGGIVLEKQCKGCTRIELPQLNQKGLYYIQIYTDKGIATKKFLRI